MVNRHKINVTLYCKVKTRENPNNQTTCSEQEFGNGGKENSLLNLQQNQKQGRAVIYRDQFVGGVEGRETE